MGKYFKISVSVMLFLCLSAAGLAKEKTTVAVLPFSVHSAENIDYVQQGVWDMISSRISANDKIEVSPKDRVLANLKELNKKELTLADVYALGKKMNADFMVWGSITKIGNNVSIDGKLVDIGSYKSPVGIYAQSQGLDEIIPRINDFTQRISSHLTGDDALAKTPAALPPAAPEPSSPLSVREKAIIAGMRTSKKGTLTAIPINPDFINSPQVLNRKNFWMSQQFATEFKGMDIGDVDGDGLNEIVIIDSSNVMIYRRKGADLALVQRINGLKHENYLSVDLADINNNGTKEIIITNLYRNTLDSFVLEWRDGKYVKIASGLPWFLRVVNDSSGTPILLGQRIGFGVATYNTPIHEITWDGMQYREGKRMKIPEGLSVFGLTLDVFEKHGAERVIAFDEYDYLVIYEKTDKPLEKIHIIGGGRELLWKSDDAFGGSNNSFYPYKQQATDDEMVRKVFVNPRILTYDTNKDGKKELIMLKNISATGRLLRDTKLFTASEIYNLEWDGLGLAENWRTQKINGYIADYQLKDIDNDGQNDLVLALVLSVGASLQDKSIIAAYKLSLPEEAASKQ